MRSIINYLCNLMENSNEYDRLTDGLIYSFSFEELLTSQGETIEKTGISWEENWFVLRIYLPSTLILGELV